jgi:hypothetical protein
MGHTAQVSEARWTCGQDGHCILTGRWLRHFTAYVMDRRLLLSYQAVSLSDRSCVAGRRQSPAMSQSRRTVYTAIHQGGAGQLAYQAVSLSDRSCMAGRRQSPAMSQSRRTVYTAIRQGRDQNCGFWVPLDSPRANRGISVA